MRKKYRNATIGLVVVIMIVVAGVAWQRHAWNRDIQLLKDVITSQDSTISTSYGTAKRTNECYPDGQPTTCPAYAVDITKEQCERLAVQFDTKNMQSCGHAYKVVEHEGRQVKLSLSDEGSGSYRLYALLER